MTPTFHSLGIGPPGYRFGVAWVSGERWRFGRLALVGGFGRYAITIGVGEQEDPSATCRVLACGPFSVALHDLGVP